MNLSHGFFEVEVFVLLFGSNSYIASGGKAPVVCFDLFAVHQLDQSFHIVQFCIRETFGEPVSLLPEISYLFELHNGLCPGFIKLFQSTAYCTYSVIPFSFGKGLGRGCLLKCLEKATLPDRKKLTGLYQDKTLGSAAKISEVLEIFEKYEVKEGSTHEMENFFNQALIAIKSTSAPQNKKNVLIGFAEWLYKRDH